MIQSTLITVAFCLNFFDSFSFLFGSSIVIPTSLLFYSLLAYFLNPSLSVMYIPRISFSLNAFISIYTFLSSLYSLDFSLMSCYFNFNFPRFLTVFWVPLFTKKKTFISPLEWIIIQNAQIWLNFLLFIQHQRGKNKIRKVRRILFHCLQNLQARNSLLFKHTDPVSSISTVKFNIQESYVLPQTVFLCVSYGSQNKQRLFPYTALTDWFL